MQEIQAVLEIFLLHQVFQEHRLHSKLLGPGAEHRIWYQKVQKAGEQGVVERAQVVEEVKGWHCQFVVE